MSKLKLLLLTGIAAVTVGTGALTAAPSASAAPQPPRKGKIAKPVPLLRFQFNTVLIT